MLNFGVVDPPKGSKAKAFGAYYTDQRVANFLVRWAVRTPTDRVMDPSFGGGVFLEAALKHLERLGGDYSSQVYGVEIDEQIYQQTACHSPLRGVHTRNLIRSDFFDVCPRDLKPLDVVVGNPPFIRYQRFSGEDRQLALRRAAEQGVKLSQRVSSWAPFLVHSGAFLKPGGRLGVVIPTELAHAAYARPVLNYLTENFRRTTLLTFQERLFPNLGQDTLLLLAEGKGEPGGLFLRDLTGVADLEFDVGASPLHAEEIDTEALTSGRRTLAPYWISKEARGLYDHLARSEQTERLGELAEVGIGYVTGANRFFHLSQKEVKARGIAHPYLVPALYRGRALSGLHFSKSDWTEAEEVGEAGYLFAVPHQEHLPNAVKAYIAEGEAREVHQAYKCRVRSPWYSVPHVHKPGAFLTYMSGLKPLLVANDAEVVAPNSLHAVRLRPQITFSARNLALLWQTSLTSLSVELEGHALGGGMLKLEPSEARSVLLAYPERTEFEAVTQKVFQEVDDLLRSGHAQAAREVADEVVLGNLLGLSDGDVRLLRRAADWLRDRRYYRGKRSLAREVSET